jgi:hypothetical protein
MRVGQLASGETFVHMFGRSERRMRSVAFNLRHIARWTDHMHWAVGSLTPGLRERDEDASAELPLPAKDDLLAYATCAFQVADTAVREVHDDDLARSAEFEPAMAPWTSKSDYGTVANWILGGIRHDSRHLGMIEALKGAMGMRGTATE